ncbi:uncharacterized protein MYCFIDRAFT_207989 [Pseudocercospora fijiensis CIRAD86]|uniref:DUF2423 domain-containing protein n=1 Tax=Pseudocercospora fijiensis (strain CIRAD86) TaxID=383855 RepID=M2ZSD6_PSEFD|nr:uncharacterized protein MYCFIDRAFT_207989 [Pseudocercospora fijiensis CIRAD86]EME81934.1 hypothetical protein MYCFIDRAFT_207989 [Pseudocercospora fijiensis CIRAD86]
MRVLEYDLTRSGVFAGQPAARSTVHSQTPAVISAIGRACGCCRPTCISISIIFLRSTSLQNTLDAAMGSSARASRIKKNNSALKKRVFGPVEQARNERLSAKLLALAKAPKDEKMDIEQEDEHYADAIAEAGAKEMAKENEAAAEDVEMDAPTKKTRSKREVKRLQEARAQRQEKKSRKRARNQVANSDFPSAQHGSHKVQGLFSTLKGAWMEEMVSLWKTGHAIRLLGLVEEQIHVGMQETNEMGSCRGTMSKSHIHKRPGFHFHHATFLKKYYAPIQTLHACTTKCVIVKGRIMFCLSCAFMYGPKTILVLGYHDTGVWVSTLSSPIALKSQKKNWTCPSCPKV